MGVDLFRFGLIQRHKSVENVIASCSVIRASCTRVRKHNSLAAFGGGQWRRNIGVSYLHNLGNNSA
jgi:hypothetical protein